MDTVPINPISDPRVRYCSAELNGRTYQYLLGVPKDQYRATVFLIHGWPDISMGWRNQIPVFLSLGYRVVCPDIMGFGGTDAPQVPPESMALYGHKRAADDIKELARQLGTSRIILGGHDWGGSIVYRVALWHPEFVTHLFSVCTPFAPPQKEYKPLEFHINQGKLLNFRYQLRLADGQIEGLKSRDQIRQFLNGMYGGRGPNGEFAFDTQQGVYLDRLPFLGKTPLVSDDILDHYADQYEKNGMSGLSNWYRAREQNFQDELQLEKTTIEIPVLFIQATKDRTLPPLMSEGMESYLLNLTRRSVVANHWALWEAPIEVNGHITEWLERTTKDGRSKL